MGDAAPVTQGLCLELMVSCATYSEVGTTHATNQDACCVKVATSPSGDVVMAVVCDGVGGLSLGELASATVVTAFSRWFEERLPVLIDSCEEGTFDPLLAQHPWEELLQRLDANIKTHGEREAAQLGTTFTGILCCGDAYLIGHVGDCRIYELVEGCATQLTEDQTLVAQELARGAITPEQAQDHPQASVILQAVGTGRGIAPAYYAGILNHEAIYVLATDGAYKKPGTVGVETSFSVQQVDDGALELGCKSLVEAALARGEQDNLTALAFSFASGKA